METKDHRNTFRSYNMDKRLCNIITYHRKRNGFNGFTKVLYFSCRIYNGFIFQKHTRYVISHISEVHGFLYTLIPSFLRFRETFSISVWYIYSTFSVGPCGLVTSWRWLVFVFHIKVFWSETFLKGLGWEKNEVFIDNCEV